MELKARIYKARRDANLTQDQLADAVKKTRSAVTQWESGDVRPRHSTLVAIAKATGKPLSWLENGVDNERSGLMVVGEVAAGLWKEGSVEYIPRSMPVAPHPDYPPQSQRLYQVSGQSVNRVVGHGEYVHCVSVADGAIYPESGDLVIVRRTEHGLTEYTAKRLLIVDGENILRPESLEAEWQKDIVIDGNDDTQIEITDVVIAKWVPFRRL
ncbi:helix-turn-helix domain-containing protein [Rhizobium tumorigenes]|uniref:helix-turn-helix domain-containing protein n=1 Tax=Rhizobium tumorigenes TaxID=2041385 RepID=UPI00241E0199|nr:helix-turn-helix domain-containing protein [Rhizobium tumorigenes]WFS01611.1 helix-turn-helix domain-containing protein [Rhizobium tumorigenes]